MKKKIIISIFVILFLILVAGGGFFWWQRREIKGNPEDYTIKETPEGKIVENKRAGLTVKVPEGWEAKKIEFLEGAIEFDTKDAEGTWRNGIMSAPFKKGCAIGGGMIYKKMSFDEIKKEIKDIHFGLGIKSDEFEEIEINNRKALKNSFDSTRIGPGISIYIPDKNKVYNFAVYWGPQDKDRCIQEFNNFLETVSIE